MATQLYDEAWVAEAVRRLADEIHADRAPGAGRALVGIRTRGAILAERRHAALAERGLDAPRGFLDATMYRDDLHTGAGLKEIKATEITFDLTDRTLVLVDDVVSTGRTVRAAMEALFAYGRPAAIRLLAMLDRGGRELPIRPDFVGARVEVPRGSFVRLRLAEVDDADAVWVVGPGEEEPA